jgi:CCR4-NOT transcription complex subunit 3
LTGGKRDSYFYNQADEEFEEDEGIYDDLNLDEEEEKWGFGKEDEDVSESEEGSERMFMSMTTTTSHVPVADFPPRTPLKKYEEDSPSSSKRDGSPILKKAPATLQLRSKLVFCFFWNTIDSLVLP